MEPKDTHLSTDEHQVRRHKVTALRSLGIEPWPQAKPVNAYCKDILDEWQPDTQSRQYDVAGRIMTLRMHGKTAFAHIQDSAGVVQIYLRQDDLGDLLFKQWQDYIDIGDIVWVSGHSFKTKTGEITLKVHTYTLLSKCLYPLPDKFHGMSNIESIYRHRYLDLISNPESKKRFYNRFAIIRAMRNFFDAHGFVEVETPMLHPIPGGAAARPFVTHHNALDIELYLRIAPELYLKRLVVGGIERVYEINRNFRNEGISTRHNPEFTMVEFYIAHHDYHYMMDFVETMLRTIVTQVCQVLCVPFGERIIDFEKPFTRMSMQEAVGHHTGISIAQVQDEVHLDMQLRLQGIMLANKNAGWGEKLYALFEHLVEPTLQHPTFITGFPLSVSPLSKKSSDNPLLTDRFELFVAGMELANGFNELNDPDDQAERFKGQVEARESGDVEAHHYDADYIKALEYALPPTVGAGIGIDRLSMLLTNTTSIKDVILFPTLKPEHDSKSKLYSGILENSIRIDPVIFSKFPEVKIGVLIGKNLNNKKSSSDLLHKLRQEEKRIQTEYTVENLSTLPKIIDWREAYKAFGSKPSEFRPSVEALLRRIVQGKQLPSINSIVDIYNLISIKYILPAGGDDLDCVESGISLTIAKGNERFIVLGSSKLDAIRTGEVIYRDAHDVLCRSWNYRECDKTKITEQTKNVCLVLEGLAHTSYDELSQALSELKQLLAIHCNGELSEYILDQKNPESSLL